MLLKCEFHFEPRHHLIVKIDRLVYTNKIDKYMSVADKIERVNTNMIFRRKFMVIN